MQNGFGPKMAIEQALSSPSSRVKADSYMDLTSKEETILCNNEDKEIKYVTSGDKKNFELSISFLAEEEFEMKKPIPNREVYLFGTFKEKTTKCTFCVKGFKIFASKENQFILEPTGYEQEIKRVDDTVDEQEKKILNLDKEKKYLLPLDENELEKLSNGKELEEYKGSLDLGEIYGQVIEKQNKSLCGLGCMYGDESSCCGCLYW